MSEQPQIEEWICTPILRWRKNLDQRLGVMLDGSITAIAYGELAPTLQQLWNERRSGTTEWRDVPIET